MNKAMRFVALLAMGTAVATAALADQKFSGFLGDYSKLASEKDAAGDPVLRYVNPNLKPGVYQKVLIDAVQFYPAPRASEHVNEQTLNEIRNYMDKGLRDKLGAKLALASEPGPGVMRIRPAITAVAGKSPGLKPYEILPIGFAISAAKGRDKEATIEIEVEMVDSMSGERMAASVRQGVGAKLEGKDAKLTLNHLRPLLDKWIDTGSAFVAERFR